MSARFLAQIADKMGATRLLNGSKDVTERILPVAAQFAVDSNQETRLAIKIAIKNYHSSNFF